MDEGSQSSSQSPSPPPQPAAARVTVAAPPQNTLTLALPIQQPRPGAGGREDCWSEGATSALIDAWGERYLELSRGNLKQKQWQEVADAVCSRDDYTKPPKSDVQCKNRIDTLKKKYKLEKSKHATSSWPFFHRLDLLIGSKPSLPSITNHSRATIAAAAAAAAAGTTKIAPFPQRRRTLLPPQPQNLKRSISESQSSDSSLPPETQNGTKRQPTASGRIRGLTELAQAIVRFGAVYERVESSKLQQALEMEKQRLGFARELELQRAHFFTKTQAELSQLKRRRRRRRRPSIGTSNIINNNSSMV